jgi:hypothetical protein
MRAAGRAAEPGSDAEALEQTSVWFVRHGLPYFAPEQRDAARAALRSRRTAAMLVLTVLLALAAGIPLAWFVGSVALAPATLMLLVGVGLLLYGLTALRARPIATWAVGRTMSSLRQVLPLATRALPLLLIFVTFLFVNAEVWQLAATLDGGVLWLTVMLFGLVAVVFLVVRLPEELDDPATVPDRQRLVEACRRTPLESRAEEAAAAADDAFLAEATQVSGFEKANLILVLVIAQAVQVLLLSLSVFAFFLLFGALVMTEGVQEAWTAAPVDSFDLVSNVSVELLQVSVFLASFSGLYFTVSAVTEESYRDQFFVEVKRELDRAVGVRAVYLALRDRRGRAGTP